MKMKSSRAPLAAAAVVLAAAPATADLTITVSNDVTRPQPIAVVPFVQPAEVNVDIAQIIQDDLGRSGLFRTLPRNDMLEKPTEVAQVNPRNWRAVGMDNVVIGTVGPGSPLGTINVGFHLIDTTRGDDPNSAVTLSGDSIIGQRNHWRSAAHKVSDQIYQKLTGIRGVFDTQMAYVTSSGTGNSHRSELIVADADGQDPQPVTISRDPLMSPAWSPDGSKLAFVAFDRRGGSAIYIQDWRLGSLKKFVGERGINGAPAWSPDGSKLAVTLSFERNPDIYVIDVASGNRTRITTDAGIDTEASWSPDGRTIAWVSDRGGQPQIYTTPSTGGGPQARLTFQGVRNEDPVYSPDGKTLAVVNNDGSGFRIGLMDLQTGALRLISEGPLDEHPSFAPNGQVVIYTSQGPRGEELKTASLDGRVHETLSEPGDVREPAWSPFPPEQSAR